MGILYGLTQ